jgi:mannose-6-phosphate isomerase
LGTSFSIAADEDSTYLESLLNQYRIKIENTRRKTGLQDPLKLAVVTGFLLCDDVQKAQKNRVFGRNSPDQDEAERLTLDLITRIDEVLVGNEAAEKQRLFRLKNTVKHYPWGSPKWIPRLLNAVNETGEPWAELWMGVHPDGSSLTESGGETLPLRTLIDREPVRLLGEAVNAEFGGLPFLFKILAAEKPLSVQAHPNLQQAREGWERENRAGIPLSAPERNYRDANHKPEILAALTPFRAICGFREIPEIVKLLELFGGMDGAEDRPVVHPSAVLREELGRLRASLEVENGLAVFLAALFGMGKEARHDLGVYASAQIPQLERDYPEYAGEWRTVAWLARLYPEDPALIAPLYLNLIYLKPTEAVFIPAGVLHAYIEGLGVELMANSDNVLRGGLSSKHVDPAELGRILRDSPFKPEILEPCAEESGGVWAAYPANCREFSLFRAKSEGETIGFPPENSPDFSPDFSGESPAIIMVTAGEALLETSGGQEALALKQGESAFIAAGTDAKLTGAFTVYVSIAGRAGADEEQADAVGQAAPPSPGQA